MVSWEIYFYRVWSGQPTINRRLKRTCWCDIGLKMVCHTRQTIFKPMSHQHVRGVFLISTSGDIRYYPVDFDHYKMCMGIWCHERYISIESEVGSLQSTDASSGHVDVTLAWKWSATHGRPFSSQCHINMSAASFDCGLPTSDSIEIYLSWDQIPIYIWDESGHHLPTY